MLAAVTVTSGNGSDGRSVGCTHYRPTITGGLAQWTGWTLCVGRWSQQAGAALCCVSAKDNNSPHWPIIVFGLTLSRYIRCASCIAS